MTRETSVQTKPQVETATRSTDGLLQRKCSCGHHTGGGECTECRRKKQRLQRRATDGREQFEQDPILSFAKSEPRYGFNLTRIQPKLRVGAPGDAFERQADRIANSVLRKPALALGIGRQKNGTVQRKCGQCGHESSVNAGASSTSFSYALGSLNGGGRALPEPTRSFFEHRMGHDFADIRVHTDTMADQLAGSMQAKAFTYGHHIVFAKGQYAQNTAESQRLLAHELAHTIQQGAASPLSDATSTTAALGESSLVRRPDAPELLRACIDLVPLPPMSCQIALSTPDNSAPFVEFAQDSSVLTPAARATLQAIAAAWNAGSRTEILRIDGFASVEGEESHNCPLSCDRANAVAAELNAPTNGDPGVPFTHLEIFAQGETDQFSRSLPPNRRVVVTTTGGPPPTPETITSQTVAVSPGLRTRTTIGVGEEVDLTHAPGAAAWATTSGTLSAANGVTVRLTAPDTAQRITVTAGAANLWFEVLAPSSVSMDREPGTGVKHAVNRPDSGIQTRVFLGPDNVNFYRVRYRELDVNANATVPGAYACFAAGTGHCGAGGGGAPCPDKALSATVVAGMGTQSVLGDCAYSGDCTTPPPFVPGNLLFTIPYEYRVVGLATFYRFRYVTQLHVLGANRSTLTTSKAGALGATTVASPTVVIPQCP